ncbi:MAG: M16 family metallopeptidase, partial [Burkholderiales bacterium]
MRRLLALLLLGFALPALAAGVPRKLTEVEGVSEYRLDNGLRVLLVPDASADTVTVHITYLVGSRHEGYGEKGMAHLLEHMLFKGSTRHPDVKQEFASRGARWNGSTSDDRTNYFETLPASGDNLEWALAMEADRMLNSFVRKADLEAEMTVVRNEFEMGENSPGSILFQRMQRLAFAWHNYGHAIIGARSDIESVPIERLRAFYRTWYQPDNALLVVGGRIEPRRALALITRHFGPLPRPARKLPVLYTVEPPQDGERSVTLHRTGDTPIVAVLYRAPAGSHPDFPALEVLVEVMRAAPQGRLHRALVQKGLASATWGFERALHDPGYVAFGASLPKDGTLDAAREALLATLDGVRRAPVSTEELERARTTLLNQMDKARLDVRE